MPEIRGAEQAVTLPEPGARKQEHEKSVQGEGQRIDTSLLMGDPYPQLPYFSSPFCTIICKRIFIFHRSQVKLLAMSMETAASYHYLEARPHPWRKILWLKGRHMHVWHVVATMLREEETPEETAKNFGLPVEAVHEALNYYQRNKALVDAETAEEGRRLRIKGQL
jgi:uncharacterized protein (DUF433 family)